MTFEQEFQKQWTSLCNYLNSEIIKSNNGNVDWNRIQTIFESEKKKWFLPGQYNNAWFEKLKRTNPDVAQKFKDALKASKVDEVISESKNTPVVAIATTVVCGAIGFGLSRIFTLTIMLSLLLTVGGIAIGGVVGSTLYSKKKNKALEELCSAYVKQLKEEGQVLALIVSRAN